MSGSRFDETVVFSSWHGRWSDSPRAIARELARRGARLRHRWILDRSAGPGPEGAERLVPGTAEARSALEAASFIVSNDVLPLDFAKRDDAVYLQTWHGTPLKRIAYDVAHPQFPGHDRYYGLELGRDVARWDALLSPNAYGTDILREAFRFGGRIIESGYPRNDVLLSRDTGAIRARVRAQLGLRDDALVVLYAPTWRESFSMTLRLDVARLHAALGEDVVVLVRAHGLTATGSARSAGGPGWHDVTLWPEIADLYIAADVLLTDYSSAMFDFAITGKPQLFFTYDLEHYRDRVRGFYFDFERDAPGPLLTTTDEVVAALRDLDAVTRAYADAYGRFTRRFCHRDDGRAAERVVDAVFGRVLGEAPAPAVPVN